MISNMTTEQYLLELIEAKADMKAALKEKGVEVWGGLNTYPDAIRELAPMGVLTVYDGTKFRRSRWVDAPLMNTSMVTNMDSMFMECQSLVSIPQLDTSNVTIMKQMFRFCSDLESIPEIDTSNVTDMEWMFDGCTSLTTVPPIDTSNVTNMFGMFSGCSSLRTIKFTGSASDVGDIRLIFDGCRDLTIYCPKLNEENYTRIINALPEGSSVVWY